MKNLQQQPTPSPETVWAILQENAQQMKESREEFDRRMAEMNKKLEGISDSQGSFAEEYFFNSFEKGKKDFFGTQFNEITKKLDLFWQGLKDEYDIVMYNDTFVAIVEVKYKARKEAINQVLKKAETFKILSPHYKDFKIYLGLAALVFPKHIEEECKKEGIAIIKQVGDMVVINDKHLKVF
jgi:hypothetical protein